MIVAWLFVLLMVFAGLTALCTLWAVLGCLRDAVSRNSFPSVSHLHDVERNEPARPLRNSTRSTTTSLATSPVRRGSPTINTVSPLLSQHEEEAHHLNEPARLQNMSRLNINIAPLTGPIIQGETSITMPSPVQVMENLPCQNTAPAILQSSPSRGLNRFEPGIRRARTVAEGSGYRMIALLVPENHRIFSQRGSDRVVVHTRSLPEDAEHSTAA